MTMAKPAPANFKYAPLPEEPATIRLLRVSNSASARSPNIITCHLESFGLSNAPRFHALSYTWGDPLDQRLSSSCNIKPMSNELDRYVVTEEDGSVIGATENLIDALHVLSSRETKDDGDDGAPAQVYWWWVDALCINQNDYMEKNVQVAMMDKIYDRADKVLIWLGKADEHTEGAIRVLNGLARPDIDVAEASRRSWDSSSGYGATDEMMDASALLGLDDLDPQDWLDYAAFLQRKWFSRIWVVQEKFFARETEVLCGEKHVVPWPVIMRSSEVLIGTGLNYLLATLVDYTLDEAGYDIDTAAAYLPGSRLDNQQIFSMVRRDNNVRGMGLAKLLLCAKMFDATNDKDKIFAIKGIWENSQPPPPPAPASDNVDDAQQQQQQQQLKIQVDYGRDLEDIYADATVLAIREANRLDVLGLVEDPLSRNQPGKWASWIPDYSRRSTMHPLILSLHGSDDDDVSSTTTKWNASGAMPFECPRRIIDQDGSNGLAIKGICVDEISQTGPTYVEVMNKYQLGSLLRILADNNNVTARYPSSSNQARGASFLRALTKGGTTTTHDHDREPSQDGSFSPFSAFVMKRVQEILERVAGLRERGYTAEAEKSEEFLVALQHQLDELSSSGFDIVPSAAETARLVSIATSSMSGSAAEEKEEEAELEARRKDMEASFRVAYLGRRVFVTKKQGYFGLTSESVRKGDKVYLLAGGRTPFVLRPLVEEEGEKEGGRRNGFFFASMVGEAYVDGIMQGEEEEALAIASGVQDVEDIVLV